jgi:hypothetical protein
VSVFHSPVGKTALRAVASLVIIAFGVQAGALGPLPVSIPGILICAAGALTLVYALYQGAQELRTRPDPYDLSRLFDEPPAEKPEEPEELDADRDRELIYCHQCGASMPSTVAHCLDCGHRLGT